MVDSPISEFPYIVGATFTIHADTQTSIEDIASDVKALGPRASEVTQSRNSSYQLKITKTIAVGEKRDAQVVLCHISPDIGNGSRELVAKIWDPAYRRDPVEWETRSAVELADGEYQNETAAFERIAASQYPPPWRCTPEYHGSWSLQYLHASSPSAPPAIRVGDRGKENQTILRTVHLVLQEYIDGCSVLSLSTRKRGLDYFVVERCTEGYRLFVWAQVLEIESWLNHIGVDHNDVAAQNVMIHPAPVPPTLTDNNSTCTLVELQEARLPRVVFIDFDMASIKPASQFAQPQNPIDKHWSRGKDPLQGWIPRWWRGDFPKRREWLLQEFGESKYFGKASPDKGREHIYVFSSDDERRMNEWGFKPSITK